MKEKTSAIIALAVLLALAGGAAVFYRDSIFGAWNKAAQTVSQFAPQDFSNALDQIKQEVIAPSPLDIGGQANNVALSAKKVIALTNVQRFDNGQLPPLIENAKLDAAAKAKADDLFKNQYFAHVSPGGVDPGKLAQSFGYDYIVEGENLILGNFSGEQEMVQDWMNSPEHRANILNNRYVDIGVAVEKGQYQGRIVWIGVQEFGLPLSSCRQPDTSLKATIDANVAQLDQWSSQIDQLKAQIDQTNPHSSEYRQLVAQYNQLVDKYNSLNNETKNLIVQYNGQVNTFNQCVNGS